ncbi:hypothetical protein E2C01_006438 [Portunus trituberculatus]|uniref:Uncharacterized protein n=1 Tax=Portunus trituberculatus TaxID=210409 RepID=A0A5B7D1U1_PORTR|nr:hypothetical protein [Portunus trituberculatus]
MHSSNISHYLSEAPSFLPSCLVVIPSSEVDTAPRVRATVSHFRSLTLYHPSSWTCVNVITEVSLQLSFDSAFRALPCITACTFPASTTATDQELYHLPQWLTERHRTKGWALNDSGVDSADSESKGLESTPTPESTPRLNDSSHNSM